MTEVMTGVRILEVAEHTFVPAASALLSDWGAEVIKIEHVERGDAMRGLASTGTADFGTEVHVLLEHSNRGKKSLGLDLTSDEGLDVLYRLAATCDVFLTNKLPSVRTKLRIDVDDIRAHNPNIIYVRGTGHGERGPDADRGSYDTLAYWHRAGMSMSVKQADENYLVSQPAPAFGDSIGAMTIAGGIMGALFHRERTGEATTVDVSLLGVGMWSMGAALALSLQLEKPFAHPPRGGAPGNPLVATYQTKDGGFISLACLQAAKYWPSVCEAIERPELVSDDRFSDMTALREHAADVVRLLTDAFATRTVAEWRERLADFPGQWTVAQDTLEVAADAQTTANGYILESATADGIPFKLVAAPVQYGGIPAQPTRAPAFNEHGDEILSELGVDWDTVVDLKVRGIVA